MSKPAATMGSNHQCPKSSGRTPHVGGPIAQGAGNVLITGKPAARMGDQLVCNGPPDQIVQGSSSVLINGKPAARLGDATKHGGKIVEGEASVLIGE